MCTLVPLLSAWTATLLAGAELPAAGLKAHVNGSTLWKVSIEESKAGTCTLHGSGPKWTSAPKRTLESPKCDEFRDLVTAATMRLPSATPDKPREILVDEPQYELVFRGKFYPIAFNAPEICAIQASGELSCRKNNLDAFQRLLIFLRGFVSSVKQ